MSHLLHTGAPVRTPELVILGGPNSGKTHYAGQLYGRIRRRPGLLRLRHEQGTPSNLAALEEVLRCLEEGHAASHTSADAWAEVLLPLVDERGNAIDLRWPDYGGEQLRSVFESRAVSDAWRLRLTKADGWILLIRLKSEPTYPDAFEELKKSKEKASSSNTARAVSWDANARWVELLQILLHVAGLGQLSRLQRPRLAVLLSCYDELGAAPQQPPREVLNETLPLMSSFIESTWAPGEASIWGLSSLGCLLEPNSENATFIDEGPEHQGWLVPPEGGTSDTDLTRPLAWLVGSR
ncbi:hypothetical protein [Polyangium sp. 6x1]|uniref:TRAFAC clade GTPase domain-containing protein n=1 Tax=Polyangium sp. 6x1 TaxID=3042689 RepID=UPI0024827A2E|nr:hypothetical protein [Polyangium sp. 6x1]MDI1444865.1 hypothetical protein [Polyangium sp. 6x1]